ncbi:MAG: TIGR00300 family protein, partial [Nostoc sp.]
ESRVIRMEGHLLDAGLINHALDLIIDTGGSFQVLNFNLGEQRQSTSAAEVKVSAPSHEVMEEIISLLIDLGAVDLPHDERDAKLEPVIQAGVAPDDFYVSTIYPTEVRINGLWVKVENQRMDGAIAITQTANGLLARCKILRDLEVGEQVIVDV